MLRNLLLFIPRKLRLFWLILIGLCVAIFTISTFSFVYTNLIQTPSDSFKTSGAGSDLVLPATALDPTTYGNGIRRTTKLLNSSTALHKNTVRILFYGQSITKQNWWLDVANDLRQQFPQANLIFDNRAIGAFDSSRLVRTAESDLYPFYPDLMIFHVYGREEPYESIIAEARRRTTAEIILISDHITWLPENTDTDNRDQIKTYKWHNTHSTQWLPTLAKKYGCELIEIRRPWEQYLRQNNLKAKDLLRDEIHLNDRGNHLMADLVKVHLHKLPKSPTNSENGPVQSYTVGNNARWKDNKLRLEFEGNRVALIESSNDSGRSIPARILIDGKIPSSFPELYTISRTSNTLGVEWPAILRIASNKPLVLEDWTAVITDIDDKSSKFKFDVFGSETGFDGSGNSEQKFISQSGRVVIDPRDWWLKTAYEFSGQSTPVGFQIRWQVKPMFTDIYTPLKAQDETREYSTVVAQNLSNSKHILEIILEGGKEVPIKEVRVYNPLLNAS